MIASRNSMLAVKIIDSRMACSQFERLMWVGFGAQDALRLALEQVDRAKPGSRAAIKQLWRRLGADADGFDLE